MAEENNDQATGVDGDGTGADSLGNIITKSDSFLDNMDVKYKNDANFKKFSSVEQVLDSYSELSKTLGKDKSVVPIEGDDYNAQFEQYMSKVGMPETADGYSLEDYNLADMGLEGVVETGDFKNIARELGMTDTQAKGVFDYYIGDMKANQERGAEQALQAKNEAVTSLRKEYGAAYEESLQNATSLFESKFPSLAGNPELVNNPAFIRDLVNMSKNFNESSLGKPTGSSVKTPGEAKAEKESVMESPAYTDILHPEHSATVEKYRALLAMELANATS